jgi:hypothetical protein
VANLNLDRFTSAYLECALWSTSDESTPQGGEPFDRNYAIADFAAEALTQAVADCEKFQRENEDDIGGLQDRAGYDFWLTRNKHGAGYLDGDWQPQEVGDRLTEAAHRFGEVYLYVGDNGKLYFSR